MLTNMLLTWHLILTKLLVISGSYKLVNLSQCDGHSGTLDH